VGVLLFRDDGTLIEVNDAFGVWQTTRTTTVSQTQPRRTGRSWLACGFAAKTWLPSRGPVVSRRASASMCAATDRVRE
jgi:hypothetical protein